MCIRDSLNCFFYFTQRSGGHYTGTDSVATDVDAVDVFDSLNPALSVQMSKHQCRQILDRADQLQRQIFIDIDLSLIHIFTLHTMLYRPYNVVNSLI